MAERKRSILVALRAVNRIGKPSDEGHSLAHQIGAAGEMIPEEVPKEPEEWTVFGERRMVRSLPSHLECLETPFTHAGVNYIERIERKLFSKKKYRDREEIVIPDYQALEILALRRELHKAPERIAELEKLVETLTLQLTGVIG